MGAGLALAMRKRIQGLYVAYRTACDHNEIHVGRCWLWQGNYPQSVVCFPSKDLWRLPSTHEMIELALESVVQSYRHWGIRSLAIPAVGCGYGDLSYREVVRPLLYEYLDNIDLEVTIHLPYNF